MCLFSLEPEATQVCCSLGFVEAGLGSRGLQQLGGLAGRNAEHGAVGDVAEDAPVAPPGRSLRGRGRRQGAHLVDAAGRGDRLANQREVTRSPQGEGDKETNWCKLKETLIKLKG